jgi:hypothetical protein
MTPNTQPTKAEAIYGWPLPAPVLVTMDDATLERMCRAHWPTWDRMRPDHQRKWRAKMKAAMLASWSYIKP